MQSELAPQEAAKRRLTVLGRLDFVCFGFFLIFLASDMGSVYYGKPLCSLQFVLGSLCSGLLLYQLPCLMG